MTTIHEIDQIDAPKFLKLVLTIDQEANFLLFDKKERKNDEQLTRSYIEKLNNNPSSVLLVASNSLGEFVGYVAGEQSHLSRLQHILNINIAVKRKSTHATTGSKLLTALAKHAKAHSIRRLEGTIVSENRAALLLARRMGYIIEGTKQDAIKINNKYYSLHMIAKKITLD